MQLALVLVHSPLVGPLTWEPVAERLRCAGRLVLVPSLAGVADGGPPYYRRLAGRVAAEVAGECAGRSVTLAGHSGAGALLPAIAEDLAAHGAVGKVRGAIFVDAILPHPGLTWFDTAPTELREHVLALARSGRLPKWNEWFPADAVSALLPEAGLRERFVAELPELPVAYFAEPAPQLPGWPLAHCAYLRLSEAYEEFANQAERRGWPVRREDADHLAILTQPDRIAAIIGELVAGPLSLWPAGPPVRRR